jgi:hypothetical protein
MKKILTKFLVLAVIVILTILFITPSLIYADTYTVSGYVKDKDGNPLPGMKVWAYNNDLSFQQSVLTNSSGYYTISVPNDNLWFYCHSYSNDEYVEVYRSTDGSSINWYKFADGESTTIFPPSCKFTINSNLENFNFTTEKGYRVLGYVYDYDSGEKITRIPNNSQDYYRIYIDDNSGTIYSYKMGWGDRWSAGFFPLDTKIKLYFSASGYLPSWYDNKNNQDEADLIVLTSNRDDIRINLKKSISSTPSRPLTPEEIVLLNLSIGQQADLYGRNSTGFVKTLYDNIIGRVPDDSGLNGWVTALDNGMSPNQAVYNLVFSDELKPKISSASSEEFVTFLYKNVFNRNPDSSGYDNWVSLLKSGMSKEDVLIGFLNCYEFKNICEVFGLKTNTDISGEDIIKVIYLNDQKAVDPPGDLGPYGHAAIILGKAEGSGVYYSFGPKDDDFYTKSSIGLYAYVDADIDRVDLNLNQMSAFLKGGSGRLPSGRQYTRYISVSINKDLGNIMFKIAESKYNSGPELYNLYEHNCNQFVQEILKAGKLSFDPIEIIPNDAYNTGVSQWSGYNGYSSGSYK